ncbi:MAG: hypothetical protein ACLTDS_13600 [Bianqueaceae bacterium]
MTPIALVLLANQIRKEAPETFQYLLGRALPSRLSLEIILSGISDCNAGWNRQCRPICGRLDSTTGGHLQAADQYTVFGRVTPDQKRMLVKRQKSGHTVAMTETGLMMY